MEMILSGANDKIGSSRSKDLKAGEDIQKTKCKSMC